MSNFDKLTEEEKEEIRELLKKELDEREKAKKEKAKQSAIDAADAFLSLFGL